jgi:hypothetical protein
MARRKSKVLVGVRKSLAGAARSRRMSYGPTNKPNGAACCCKTRQGKPCPITADRKRKGKWYCHVHDPFGKAQKNIKSNRKRSNKRSNDNRKAPVRRLSEQDQELSALERRLEEDLDRRIADEK